MSLFPAGATTRDEFIVGRRSRRHATDPWAPVRVTVEDERAGDGSIAPVTTIFLAGKECPWHCTMCDLWRDTTEADTPRGAIPWQIQHAWPRRPQACTTVKLYNAGSFFDPHAVPDDDYVAIVDALLGARHVIVESHPSLIGARTLRLRDLLLARGTQAAPATLEVAMGLETIHPDALQRLNKRMTMSDFVSAAGRLREQQIAVRVFLLISPPFVPAREQDEWLARSIDAAVANGATAVSLIPVRSGNGTLDVLAGNGAFVEPGIDDVERSLALGLARAAGSTTRVFADVWDLARFARCPACAGARRARLEQMNLTQVVLPQSACRRCGAGAMP